MNRKTLKKFVKRGIYKRRIFNTYFNYGHATNNDAIWLLLFSPNKRDSNLINYAISKINKM